jgi:hypothetical protein
VEADSGGLVGLAQRAVRGGVYDAMVSPMGVGAPAAELRDWALAEAGGSLDESISIGLETLL